MLAGEEIDNCLFLCTIQAYITARKRLPSQTLSRINKLEDVVLSNESMGSKAAAVRIGDIVVAKKVHPAIEDSRAWISPYHIDLIKDLFKEGFVIEILDEQNNPITILGETE
jgi:hypothetical protein